MLSECVLVVGASSRECRIGQLNHIYERIYLKIFWGNIITKAIAMLIWSSLPGGGLENALQIWEFPGNWNIWRNLKLAFDL